MMIAVAVFFMCFFHPGDRGTYFFTLQMFVSFTIFLEALALVPQCAHLKENKDPEGLTTYYLAALALARLMRVFFWVAMVQ